MKSSVIALMALAVLGFSGAAFAAEATKPAAMSDAEMDKVTAGAPGVDSPALVNSNAWGAGQGLGFDGHGGGKGQGPDHNNSNGRFQ